VGGMPPALTGLYVIRSFISDTLKLKNISTEEKPGLYFNGTKIINTTRNLKCNLKG
jgi:hypothetical protein